MKGEKHRMKMTEIERKLIRGLEQHKWFVLYAAVTALSMAARFALRGLISGDMRIFLRPWAELLKEYGGIRALGSQMGNYGVLYQTIIALMTYIPIQHEYAYKIFSMVFDFALAGVSAILVKDFSGSRLKTFFTYAFMIMLPSVLLNSAGWGQCDSIYTFFCVMCFWLLTREKYTLAFLSYGLAFAFKLQAVFLAPFLILFYVKEKKFSLLNFLLIPAVMIATSAVGIIEGRSVLAPFRIYLDQAGYYPSISLNYPSFWNMLVTNDVEDFYGELSGFCIAVTLTVLLAEFVLLLKRKEPFSLGAYLFAAFLMSYSCVLFLPAMHERYSYLYVMFGLMLAILEPRTLISYAFLIMLDLQTYGVYLFETPILPWYALGLINTICFLSYAMLWGKRFLQPDFSSLYRNSEQI